MSVMADKIGRWQAEGSGRSALRIDPALLAVPGATDRLVQTLLAQQSTATPGLAPVVDLVSRPDGGQDTVWLIISGPATPTLDPASARGHEARAALTVAAEALAGLHAAGAAHGDFGAGSVVTGAQPQVIEAGLRAALTGQPADAGADVAAWATLASDTARALADRDPAASIALAQAAALARGQGLSAAAAALRAAPVDANRTLLAKPGQAMPAPPPPMPSAQSPRVPDDEPPPPGATMLGKRRPTGNSAGAGARFGPGVAAAPAGAAAAWQAAVRPRPARRRRRRGLLSFLGTLLFIAAVVVAYLWWRGRLSDLHVTGARVVVPAVAHCNQTVDLVGHIATNGKSGIVRYHWVRNDGVDSGSFEQHAQPGQHDIVVHLRWTVRGKGSFDAAAILQVTAPQSATASGRFRYTCS
jgi:hypothetical protein